MPTSWPRDLQPAMEARVAPVVFVRHACHERGEVRLGTRATGWPRPRFLGDEPVVPTQDGVGRHDAGDGREVTTAEDLAFTARRRRWSSVRHSRREPWA